MNQNEPSHLPVTTPRYSSVLPSLLDVVGGSANINRLLMVVPTRKMHNATAFDATEIDVDEETQDGWPTTTTTSNVSSSAAASCDSMSSHLQPLKSRRIRAEADDSDPDDDDDNDDDRIADSDDDNEEEDDDDDDTDLLQSPKIIKQQRVTPSGEEVSSILLLADSASSKMATQMDLNDSEWCFFGLGTSFHHLELVRLSSVHSRFLLCMIIDLS